ncbi:coiled-coil domain-containing protein [Hymenobacter fodinae]|uniref:Uncharacterized protein n=1 Tax=Hymenobacter fodinae TaxID=2510796 RepID=A0A4Z0PBH9_9BACT|nr:hypothetical protein [Hymenobacter fodinae]TGE08756.1 hypothetical protein EU556_13805 [Hymenobacter fodinae]
MAEKIILEVDINYNDQRLIAIQKDLNANRQAAVDMKKAFQEGRMSSDELAAAQVRLKAQADALVKEQKILNEANAAQVRANQAQAGSLEQMQQQLKASKAAYAALSDEEKASADKGGVLKTQQDNLTASIAATKRERTEAAKAAEIARKANEAEEGSVDALKAKSAQLTAQYNAMGKENRLNTEAGKALTAELKETNEALLAAGVNVGDFRRQVGNYGVIGKDITAVIQQLVKLEEQQKQVGEGSDEYKKITTQIGFVQKAAQEAGAKAGLSFEQTQAKLKSYGDAIRPVIQEVVKLEAEQEQLEDSSEAYTRIGFKVAGLEKQLEEIPKEAKTVGSALKDAASSTDVFSGATARYNTVKERFTQIVNIAKAATAGEITLLGALKLALLATGLGAFVVVLGSLATYLTKTREGTQLLDNVMAQVSATFNVLIDRVGLAGRAIKQLFDGNFSGAAASAKAAMSGIGDEISREIVLAKDLSIERQKLERDTLRNIDTNKKLLNEVERAKNVRDNERNSIEKRQQANELAYATELRREKTLSELAQRKIALLKAEADQRGGLEKLNDEEFKTFKEAQNELRDIQEDAAGKQNELITNRFQLAKELQDREFANTKGHYTALAIAAADGSKAELNARIKAIEATAKAEASAINITGGQRREIEQRALDEIADLRREFRAKQLQAQSEELDLQLRSVKANSEEEENILRQKLSNAYQLELTQKGLSDQDRLTLEKKYNSDAAELARGFASRRKSDALQADIDTLNARLARAQVGSSEELEISRELIEKQRLLQIAALDEKQNNEARQRLINAQAEREANETRFQEASNAAERTITEQQQALERARASGALSEQQYQDAAYLQDLAAYEARIQIAKRFNKDTTDLAAQRTNVEIAQVARITAKERERLQVISDLTQDFTATVGQALGDLLTQQTADFDEFGKTLVILLLDTLQKVVLAQQAAAVTTSLAQPDSVATFGATGITRAAILSGLITAAFETAKAAITAGFAEGGRVDGPGSGTSDSIPALLSNGEHVWTAEEVHRAGGHAVVESMRQQALAGSLLSYLPIFQPQRLAIGGPVGVVASGDGGATVRASAAAAGPNIDYNQLAQAMARQPVIVDVKDINNAQGRRALVRQRTTLG